MICAFQDRDNLYLAMDLLTGGDLRYHIGRHRKFNEEQTSNCLFPNERENSSLPALSLRLSTCMRTASSIGTSNRKISFSTQMVLPPID
jgi:hypothetical protein